MEKYFEYLNILGIDTNLPISEIKKSYKELVQIFHPDRFADIKLKSRAENELKKINEAYDFVITNYERYKDVERESEFINNQSESTSSYKTKTYNSGTYKRYYFEFERTIPIQNKIAIYLLLFAIFNFIYFYVRF